jgi:hypothetical protein
LRDLSGVFLVSGDDVTLQELVDEEGAALLRFAENTQPIPYYRLGCVNNVLI